MPPESHLVRQLSSYKWKAYMKLTTQYCIYNGFCDLSRKIFSKTLLLMLEFNYYILILLKIPKFIYNFLVVANIILTIFTKVERANFYFAKS